MKLQRSILLIGFRSVGKTTVAPLLARRCGTPWSSLDTIVERMTRLSIPEMVTLYGWEYFREWEGQMMRMLLAQPPHVIDTGAGIVEHTDLFPLIEHCTWRIWLDLPWDQLLERYDPQNRPPLTSLPPQEELRLLWDRRRPLYQQWANIRIEIAGKSPQQIADLIAVAAKQEGILRDTER